MPRRGQKGKSEGLTPAQRRHLRLYGNLQDFTDGKADATPAECFLYLAAVHYRECAYYHQEKPGELTAAREMLKNMAIAVLWERNPDSVLKKGPIKGLMKYYVTLAADDPPF